MLNQKNLAFILTALLATSATDGQAQTVQSTTTTTTDALGNKTTTWSTTEDKYWSEAYINRPYYKKTVTYKTLKPAYRYGYESYTRYQGRPFEEVEQEIHTGWNDARGTSTVTWEQARGAVRDSYIRTMEENGTTTETKSSKVTRPDGSSTTTTTTEKNE